MSDLRARDAPDSGTDDTAADDLADWFAEISERLGRGEPVDPEALASAHPDRAEEILQLLPALRRMAALGPPSRRPGPTTGLGTLGDFRLLREVGRGGMGIVYEAEQVSLGRRVALKILPLAAALDPRRRGRFLQEAKAAAGLNHAHIVPVYAVGSDRGVPYYAMQLLDGCTLAEVLRALRGEPSDPLRSPDPEARPGSSLGRSIRDRDYIRAVAECGRKAAEALDHAHSRGILHRDIKPANLMLDGQGELWITDFGLAQVQGDSRLTLTGDLVGTLRYMSPEQALGGREGIDGRADVYSLGATLYELLTLRPALPGADRVEMLRRIAQGEPAPLRGLNPAVPRDLETILHKALAREPAGRYKTAGDLADDLQRFLDDRPIRARRPTILGRALRWSRRHRPQVAVGAAASMLLVAGGLVEAGRRQALQRDFDAALRAQAERADEHEREAGSRRREAASLRYADRTRRADQALRAGDLAAARSILGEVAASADGFDPREFAFGYLHRRAHPIETIPNPGGHARSCTHVSADGSTLATHDEDGPLFLLDGETGRLRAALRPAPGGWHQLSLSPDGRFVASHALGGPEGSTGLGCAWDTSTGRVVAELRRPGLQVFCLHAMAGGRLVSEEVATDGTPGTFLWEPKADSPEPRLVAKLSPSTGSVCNHVSPDGLVFATMRRSPAPGLGGRYVYEFHDTRTGKLRRRIITEGDPAAEHIGFAFLDGGRTLADLDTSGHATFWDIDTGAALDRRPFAGWSEWQYASFGDDGRSFADVRPRGGPLVLWDRDRGWTHTLPTGDAGDGATAAFASFLPGSAQLVVSSYSGSRGWSAPWVYDVQTGAKLAACPEWADPRGVRSLAVWPRGRDLLINRNAASQVWRIDATLGYDALAGHRDEAWGVAFSPDGKLVASGGDDDGDPCTVKLWDASTGRIVRQWAAHRATTGALAFQPRGRLLATAGLLAGENLRLWDSATGALVATLDGHTDRVRAIAFSPDGHLLASAGSDRTVRVWDVESRLCVATLSGHAHTVRQVAFAPDGHTLASVGEDATVNLWEVGRDSPLWSWSGGEKLTAVAFAPDGLTLAWADQAGVIRLMDPTRKAIRLTLRGEPEELRALAFAPDGRTLASAGRTGTIRLWDPASGQELLTMPGRPSQANGLAFSPDGRALAACWHDGAVRIMRSNRTDPGRR